MNRDYTIKNEPPQRVLSRDKQGISQSKIFSATFLSFNQMWEIKTIRDQIHSFTGNDDRAIRILDTQINIQKHKLVSYRKKRLPSVWRILLLHDQVNLAKYLKPSSTENQTLHSMMDECIEYLNSGPNKSSNVKTIKTIEIPRKLLAVWKVLLNKDENLLMNALGNNSYEWKEFQNTIEDQQIPLKIHFRKQFATKKIIIREKREISDILKLILKENLLAPWLGEEEGCSITTQLQSDALAWSLPIIIESKVPHTELINASVHSNDDHIWVNLHPNQIPEVLSVLMPEPKETTDHYNGSKQVLEAFFDDDSLEMNALRNSIDMYTRPRRYCMRYKVVETIPLDDDNDSEESDTTSVLSETSILADWGPFVEENRMILRKPNTKDKYEVAHSTETVIWIDNPDQYTCRNRFLPWNCVARINKPFCYRWYRPRIPLFVKDFAVNGCIRFHRWRKTMCRCWPFNSTLYEFDDGGTRMLITTHNVLSKVIAGIGWTLITLWFLSICYGALAKILGPVPPDIDDSWSEAERAEAWSYAYGNATWVDPVTDSLGVWYWYYLLMLILPICCLGCCAPPERLIILDKRDDTMKVIERRWNYCELCLSCNFCNCFMAGKPVNPVLLPMSDVRLHISKSSALAEDAWGITTWNAMQVPTIVFTNRVTDKAVYELGGQSVMTCYSGGLCGKKDHDIMKQLQTRIQGFIAQ